MAADPSQPPAWRTAPTPRAGAPADEFERFLESATEPELNAWAVRNFGGERYRLMVWLLCEVRRLRAEVAELKARKPS